MRHARRSSGFSLPGAAGLEVSKAKPTAKGSDAVGWSSTAGVNCSVSDETDETLPSRLLQCVNRDPEMADSRVDFPIAGPKFAQLPNNGPNYLRDRSLRGTVGIICGCHSDKMIIDKFRCTYQTQGIEACSSGMDARNEVQILFSVVKRFANVHVYLTTRRQMVACDYVS